MMQLHEEDKSKIKRDLFELIFSNKGPTPTTSVLTYIGEINTHDYQSRVCMVIS